MIASTQEDTNQQAKYELVDVQGMRTAKLLTYNTRLFPFAEWLAIRLFKVKKLENLHIDILGNRRKRGNSKPLDYNDNLVIRKMIQSLKDDSPFYRMYHRFIKDVISSVFGKRISYTNHPKMRCHLAGTPSVSLWHRDIEVTERLDQITVWLPFTNAFESNSLYVESDYCLGDHQPIRVNYGQALIFDGACLSHGTVPNITDVTRVSMDFRFSLQDEPLPEIANSFFKFRPSPIEGASILKTSSY